MLFTHSIRRKMALLLLMVTVMLIASSIADLASLHWYNRAIQQLDVAVNQMPRRSDLDHAAGALFKPLLAPLSPIDRQKVFSKSLTDFRIQVDEFVRGLDRLSRNPNISSQRAVSQNLFAGIDHTSDRIESIHTQLRNSDPKQHEKAVNELRYLVSLLVTQVHAIPDPQSGLHHTIRNLKEGYDTRYRWIAWSSVIVFLLFIWLLYFSYRAIFAPLRQLQRGVRRVAQGDFDYRVRLKRITIDDEIQELADAFNRMTDRFQEITTDLDEQVQQRSQQLVRSERLAGVGFLAAGVAHEINNPLSAIAMASESLEGRAAELLADSAEADRKLVTQYLGMIQRESFRCQQITRRLLDFARGQDTVRSEFDLTGIIIEVLEMVGHMGKYKERSITLQHRGPIQLEGNGAEIKQVILNLVANALEAMEDGGTLVIDLTEQTDAVMVTFRDDGIGISAEAIEHLFEPFYTRRKGGRGTGLGLSISHRIVTDHGGTIEAMSDGEGLGTTFKVRLPRRVTAKLAA